MKRRAVALAVLAILAIGLTGFWRAGTTSPKLLDVTTFMRDVERHPEVLQVRGVVSSVSAERHLFTLIDVAEYQDCRSTECAPLSLPVRYTGTMPRLRSTVHVRGRTRLMDGKLVFAADSVSLELGVKP